MNESDPMTEKIEYMTAVMVQAIPDLDCPEACDCGWTYQYMEKSAALYLEEYEWACLSTLFLRTISSKKRGNFQS